MRRVAKQRIKLLVEGHTEENYFKGLNSFENLEVKVMSTNMNGGGYTNFINKLRKESALGFLAIFIIIDLDKAIEDSGNLQKLINYCRDKNKSSDIPYFIIGTYKDFELFSCCHCSDYNFTDTGQFIKRNLNFKNISEFKGKEDIYKYLNGGNRSYMVALNKLSNREKYIVNDFKRSKKGIDIVIKSNKILLNSEVITTYHSNIEELFKIIGLRE